MILCIVLQWEKCTLRRKRRKSWFQSKRSFESRSFYGNGWFSIHVLTTAAVRNQYLEQDWWGRVWLTPIRLHDDVIKWKHFPCYLPFVRVTTDHPLTKAVTRTLMFSLMGAWTNGWANNRNAMFDTPSCSLWLHCNAQYIVRGAVVSKFDSVVC